MKMASSQEDDNLSAPDASNIVVGGTVINDDELSSSKTKLVRTDFVDTTTIKPIKTTVIKKPQSNDLFVNVNNNNSSYVDNDNDDNDDIINIRKTFLPNKLLQDIRNNSPSRNFNSLPLFQYVTELSEIGSGQPVMECMPLRQQTGGSYHHHHYHQHVTDQTKSLQELQNEVGALLEFRDLVIETFPDLKHKMASISATNTLTGMISNSSLASRREWEPGIRVKRKLIQQKDIPASSSPSTTITNTIVNNSNSNNGGTNGSGSTNSNTNNNIEMSSSSSLIRSRSNSHSGKKEPKSGEGNGSVIQDSGFSTETSSSKEAHSASSTTGAMQGAVATNRLLPNNDSDDELLNLLDVIHRKSNRLREEVEHLQSLERDNKIIRGNSSSHIHNNNHNSATAATTTSSNTNTTTIVDTSQIGCINHKQFQEHIDRLNKEDIQLLRRERDRLLDKLAEMEAETLTGRIKATKIQDQFEELITVKKELEEQLKLALSQKLELNSRLNDLNKQYSSSKSSSSQSDSSSHRHSATTVLAAPTTIGASNLIGTDRQHGLLPTTFSPVILDNNDYDDNNIVDGISVITSSSNNKQLQHKSTLYPFHSDIKQYKFELKNLGRLDGIISVPNRLGKVHVTDSKKIAAILLETNVIELQRHLLTLTVQNQVLTQRLEQASKSKLFLNKRLEKSKEDLDDLRFQLEEKDIELEGTKAQLRVLESRTPSKIDFNMTQETNRSTSTLIINRDSTTSTQLLSSTTSSSILLNSPVVVTQISTPSMKAMIPLQMDEINQQHNSSSTESAQDQTERSGINNSTINDNSFNNQQTPKRRPPSKIPLPGSKGYLAPKPPTGRQSNNIMIRSSISGGSTSSGPVSNKSLSRSTGNLYGKSPNSLSQSSNHNIQLNNRPDSAQSYRKDNSLNGGSGNGTLSRSSTSSIPISSTSPVGTLNTNNKLNPSPQKFHLNNNNTSSPVPIKPKRDIYNNMSSRARHLDSLTRLHTVSSTTNNTQSSTPISGFGNNSNNSGGNISGSSFTLNNSNNNSNNNNNSNSSSTITTTNHRINNSKKDLSSNNSFTQHGHLRKNSSTSSTNNIAVNSTTTTTTNNQRRVSSSSTGRNTIGDLQQQQQQQQQQQNDTDSGKISKIRKMLSIDSLDNTTNKIIQSSKKFPEDEQQKNFNNKENIENTILGKNSPINIKRDLVREFMLRNYPPPAILQPNHLTYLQNLQNSNVMMMNNNSSEFCDNELLNYHNVINPNCENNINENDNIKEHPQLLFEIEMEEHEDDHESDQDKDDFAKFLLNESLLSQRSKEIEKSSLLNSQLLPPLNGVVRTTINNDSECRLIGNVNPNIAKTWQQLNSNTNNSSSSSSYTKIGKNFNDNCKKKQLTRSISNNSDQSEKILFYQQVYENKDNFQVNKVKYSRENLSIEAEEYEEEEDEEHNSIESYFDSIENDIAINENVNDNEITDRHELQFHYDNDDEFIDGEQFNHDPVLNKEEEIDIISYSNQEGGEQMADINSFERRKYIFTNWSLENDSYV